MSFAPSSGAAATRAAKDGWRRCLRLVGEVKRQIKAVVNLLWPLDERATSRTEVQSHLDHAMYIAYNKHMATVGLSSDVIRTSIADAAVRVE